MGRGRYFPGRLKSTVWLECYPPSDGLPYGKFGGGQGAEMRTGAAPCSRASRDREGAHRGTEVSECPS